MKLKNPTQKPKHPVCPYCDKEMFTIIDRDNGILLECDCLKMQGRWFAPVLQFDENLELIEG